MAQRRLQRVDIDGWALHTGRGLGQYPHSETGRDEAPDACRIWGLERNLRGKSLLGCGRAQDRVQPAAGRQTDEQVVSHAAQGHYAAGVAQVSRCSYQSQAFGGQRLGGVAVRQVVVDRGDERVDAACVELREKVGYQGAAYGEGDAGVVAVKLGEHARQIERSEHLSDPETQLAAQHVGEFLEVAAGRGKLTQHRADPPQQQCPGGGEAHPSSGAFEQCGAELPLEAANRGGDSRLSDVQLARGATETTEAGDRFEVDQLAQLHQLRVLRSQCQRKMVLDTGTGRVQAEAMHQGTADRHHSDLTARDARQGGAGERPATVAGGYCLSESIDITGSGDTPMRAYVARPQDAGPRGSVIVGMELFGVSAHVRDVCDRLAAEGYVAIAPDFYHRHGEGIELPADASGRERGFALLHALSRGEVLEDVGATVEWAARGYAPVLAMVGLSVGGHIAYLAATRFALPAVAVFYGGWIPTTDLPLSQPDPTIAGTAGIRGRVQIHVGANDKLIPPSQRQQLREALTAAGVDFQLIEYPDADHGFLCDRRPSFHPVATADAWDRLLAFLGETA